MLVSISMSKRITALVVLFLLLGGALWATLAGQSAVSLPRLDTERWSVYENTKYGYDLKYPADRTQPIADSQELLSDARDVSFGQLSISVWSPYKFEVTDPASLALNRLVALDLESFARAVYQYQVDQPIEIGGLRRINFAGKPAYSFTLSKSFHVPFVQYSLSGIHNYLLFEHGDSKFVIHYPAHDDLASSILDSFELGNRR